MHRRRLVQGLTVTFGAMSLTLAAVGVTTNPALLLLAGIFGLVTALLWYHASGRLARRVYRRVERQAAVDGGDRARHGAGVGPKDDWRGPHRRRSRTAGRERGGQADNGGQPSGRASSGTRGAYEVLGLEPGADQAAIQRAYRERIKEVHPDTADGDEAAFRRVRTAYERLSD